MSKKDHICVHDAINNVKQKGLNTVTIKCSSISTASNVENLLNQKYKDAIKITKENEVKPEIKMVNVQSDNANFDYHQLIVEHNKWRSTNDFSIEQVYSLKTTKLSYYNIIITNIDTQKKILERVSIIFDISEYKCYEYFRTIQCLKCLKYGNFPRECTLKLNCKRCLEEHAADSCDVMEENYAYINCITSKKN